MHFSVSLIHSNKLKKKPFQGNDAKHAIKFSTCMPHQNPTYLTHASLNLEPHGIRVKHGGSIIFLFHRA